MKKVILIICIIILIVIVIAIAKRVVEQRNIRVPNPTLPAEYEISYQVVEENNIMSEITMIKDDTRKIYYKDSEKSLVFIPSNTGYLLYKPNDNNNFIKVDDTVYTEKYVEEQTSRFQDCIKKSNLVYSHSAKYIEDRTFLQEICSVYRIDAKIGVFSENTILTINNESGICMSWLIDKTVDGYELSNAGEFSCIKYKDSNVHFPSNIQVLY